MKAPLQDAVIVFGGSVKALGNGKVGGYLVYFSTDQDPDLAGQFFTAQTDFDLETCSSKSAMYFDHGLDPVIKQRKLAIGTLAQHDVGIWVEGQLNMRDEYEKAIYGLAEKGKLGFSSGTAPHLVESKMVGDAEWISRWPLGLDASLTTTPCEPRTKAITLKSFAVERLQSSKGLFNDKLAAQSKEIWELTENLCDIFWQIKWAAEAAEGLESEQLDFGALWSEAVNEFSVAARALAPKYFATGVADDEAYDEGLMSLRSVPVRIPLAIQSKAVRDAASGLKGRVNALHAMRKDEGKKQTLNATHHETLGQVASDLESTAKGLRALLADSGAPADPQVAAKARVEVERLIFEDQCGESE